SARSPPPASRRSSSTATTAAWASIRLASSCCRKGASRSRANRRGCSPEASSRAFSACEALGFRQDEAAAGAVREELARRVGEARFAVRDAPAQLDDAALGNDFAGLGRHRAQVVDADVDGGERL